MGLNAGSFTRGDIYPRSGRNTAEAANQGMASREATVPTPTQLGSAAGTAPMQGSPAVVLIVLILIFAALRIFAMQADKESEFESIAPSFYNIMVITLAGMLGGTLLKWVAVKALPSNNALRSFIVQG